MRTKPSAGVKSATRVLDLLEFFSATSSPATLTQIARQLGMPKSSTSALLNTLVNRGYVEADAGGYVLAARYRVSGWVGGPYARLLRSAHPVMIELSEAIRESVFLGVLNERGMVQYLDKVVSTEPLRYDVDLSKERFAYATTIGQVLLAHWSEDKLEGYLEKQPLEQITPMTEVNLEKLRAQLAKVRKYGYAELTDSHVLGVSGISAPIKDDKQEVIAALCTFGPTQRMANDWESHRAHLLQAAHVISQDLQQVS